MNYIRYSVSPEGWRPQPGKVKAIRDFPRPGTKKAKRFTGMLAFYSDCIPTIQLALEPIHRISGLKSTFLWGEEQQEAFEKAKELLLGCTMLAYPLMDEKHTMFLTTDASDLGIGTCLIQIGIDVLDQPIGFFSSPLSTGKCDPSQRGLRAQTGA